MPSFGPGALLAVVFIHALASFTQSIPKGGSQYDDIVDIRLNSHPEDATVNSILDSKADRHSYGQLLFTALFHVPLLRKLGITPLLLYIGAYSLSVAPDVIFQTAVSTQVLSDLCYLVAFALQILYLLAKAYSGATTFLLDLHGQYANRRWLTVFLDITPVLDDWLPST